MAGPNIPNLPASLPADQVSFFTALKSSLEVLTGQGRNPDDTRALLVQELASLGINTNQFLNSSSIKPYAVVSSSSGSQKVPEAPKGLTVTKGPFVHKLEWSNPSDSIVSHIEVWVAEESQDRDDALLEGIHTVTKDLRGGTGKYNNAIFDVTHDFCYWIRSISYAGKHSEWYPGEIAGGYIVTGADSVQETIDQVMDILQGQLTEDELYTDLKSRINLIDATGAHKSR